VAWQVPAHVTHVVAHVSWHVAAHVASQVWRQVAHEASQVTLQLAHVRSQVAPPEAPHPPYGPQSRVQPRQVAAPHVPTTEGQAHVSQETHVDWSQVTQVPWLHVAQVRPPWVGNGPNVPVPPPG
jgi:hypothetical protein